MPRTVRATRYVMPFREGGSVPALVECDDLGLYVVKLRGAGQGPKALVAELIGGELARASGLRVPEIALVELDIALANAEPDPEIAEPLEASSGLNVGLDYLPGSLTFDAIAGPLPSAEVASRVVLLDAFIANVDRTAKNPNLLAWHDDVFIIDHGASLYFHHGWSESTTLDGHDDPFAEVRSHVLLPQRGRDRSLRGTDGSSPKGAWSFRHRNPTRGSESRRRRSRDSSEPRSGGWPVLVVSAG